jgi:hypothetical protein
MTPHEVSISSCICGSKNCDIPRGFCHCGCKELAPIATRNKKGLPYRKGEPKMFVAGHHARIRSVPESAVPFKIDGVYCRLIPLTRGQYTIVDATDYEWLMQWKWYADWSKNIDQHYAVRNIYDGKHRRVRMHRVILGLDDKDSDLVEGDHKNTNTLDNHRKNLRRATPDENKRNRRKNKNNSVGLKGVSFDKESGEYRVSIQVNRRRIFLGRAATAEQGHKMYCDAAHLYHGEFAREV